MFWNKNRNTSTTSTVNGTNQGGLYPEKNKKYKAYRNRPSKRQALLELLSFCLILAAIPAFLGGVISIFVCIFTVILGLIGLFAWTRRHAALFALLALCIIALCIINIILRAVFVGQCMPYFRYSNQFNSNGLFVGNDDRTDDDDDNTFNNSIWCGNRKVVYITHAIILALAIPALFIALSMLIRRKKNLQNTNNSGVVNRTTTETKTERTIVTA